VENILDQLEMTTSSNEKIAILKANDSPELRKMLYLTYSTEVVTNTKVNPDDFDTGAGSILEHYTKVLDAIGECCNSHSHVKNQETVTRIARRLHPGALDVLCRTLNKSWKCGINASVINKAFPDLIEVFKVQLANKYKLDKKYKTKEWDWSYKLDGIRVVCLWEGGEWLKYTRTGNPILSLSYWDESLEDYRKQTGSTFIDGEAYRHDLTFEEIKGNVIRKKKAREEVGYHIFIEGGAVGFRSMDASDFSLPEYQNDFITPTSKGRLPLGKIEAMLEEAIMNGYEGLMFRNASKIYDFRRSNELLKFKFKNEEDGVVWAKVIGIECEDMVINEDGMMTTENLMARLIVELESGDVGPVGSGFSRPFRRATRDNPDIIIGKNIDVRHQGFGSKGKMRFPVFLRERDDL